jgi:predicted TIM-barrel fold metal-dependent hydrolase
MAKQRVVALEEHFWIPAMRDRFQGYHRGGAHQPGHKLEDLGALRLKDMDAGGIDLQILSHNQPGAQVFEPETSVTLARQANDRLDEACRAHPTRFAGFATLPTPDPKAAAAELERTVTKYGFKGAMVNGLTNGAFLDEKRFWPIFERAEALDVPIYLHPAIPHPAVIDAYFKDYKHGDYPILMGAVWGFTVETATAALRLMLSGVFDAHPRLKIIIGHMGETIPFSLWRLEWTVRHLTGRSGFAQCFRDHFWITTSGNFSHSALLCSMMELGAERILFSVDYPFNSNEAGVEFLNRAPISPADRERIFHGNAEALMKL